MKLENTTENPRRFEAGEEVIDESAESEQATPQEQEDYDLLSVRGRKIIFGEGRESILEMLGSSETPAKGIGEVAAMIMKSLVSSAEQSGREISPDAAIEAGGDIVLDLNDLAKANGVFQYDSEEDETSELADAVLWGVKFYGDGMIQSGELTPEMQQIAQQEVDRAIAEEQAAGPQKTPIAAGVGQAMAPPGGLVGDAMGGY